MNHWIKWVIAFLIFTASPYATAEVCPDSKVFGEKMITGVCWRCIFPIKIAGSLNLGSSLSSSSDNKPPDDSPSKPMCACPDPLGLPRPGISMGLWEPSHLMELVRAPYCSTVLGGKRIQKSLKPYGSEKAKEAGGGEQLSFFQYHHYAFPLLTMLDLFTEASCNTDGFMDVDLAYMSELDPTWNRDELAALVNFETVLYANPAAIMACSADAAAVNAGGRPIETLHWCAGSWGSIYPKTGRFQHRDANTGTSLLATKALSMLHHRGLYKKTSGDKAMCEPQFFPTLPKQQYKMSMFFPVSEAKGNHWIGEHSFRWGMSRNIPGISPEAVYMLYRWRDCCALF